MIYNIDYQDLEDTVDDLYQETVCKITDYDLNPTLKEQRDLLIEAMTLCDLFSDNIQGFLWKTLVHDRKLFEQSASAVYLLCDLYQKIGNRLEEVNTQLETT